MRLRSNVHVNTPLQDIDANFVTPGLGTSFVQGDPTPWVILPALMSQMVNDSSLDLGTRCHARVIMDKIDNKTSREGTYDDMLTMYLEMRNFRK